LRALVTGGAGFVGSNIVESLLARGDDVTVLDNLDPRVHSGQLPEFPSEVKFVHGDILSPTSLREALKEEVDVVFHEAAMVGLGKGVDDAEAYASTNIIGTIRLMSAIAKQDPPPRFILASSMVIYGEGAYECKVCNSPREARRKLEQLSNRIWEPLCEKCGHQLDPRPVTEAQPPRPLSVYAITKLGQEQVCMALGKQQGIPVVALRYHNIYGPRMPRDTPYAGVAAIFKSQLLAGAPPTVFEDGKQLRDFIHVQDIVQANLLAADGPEEAFAYEAFNVGTGQPHSVDDFARQLANILTPGLKPDYPGLFRLGDVRHVFASISKIKRLGFTPRVSFEDGVAEFAREPTRAAPSLVIK
jgi:dTDP-L-rhamnose 4-epimerase